MQATKPNRINVAPRVLVIDSGVGGLSVCQHIIQELPACELHYFSDNAAFPYGNKDPQFLRQRLTAIVAAFSTKLPLDVIVIACNTASTVVLPTLREKFDTPIVGVVPAIKTAANKTSTKCFALLATPGTVERQYTQDLIARFAPDQNVIKIGAPELVALIENYILTGELLSTSLANSVQPLLTHPQRDDIDSVVLGCTHFPLIQSQLAELCPNWQWLESGPAIAARILSIVEKLDGERSISEKESAEVDKPRKDEDTIRQFWSSSKTCGPDYHRSARFKDYIALMGFSGTIQTLAI